MLSQTGKLFFKIYRQTPNGPLVANTSKNMPWMSWWECQYFTTHDTKMYIQYNFWSTQEDIFRHVICKWVREHFKLQINIHNHPPRFWKKKQFTTDADLLLFGKMRGFKNNHFKHSEFTIWKPSDWGCDQCNTDTGRRLWNARHTTWFSQESPHGGMSSPYNKFLWVGKINEQIWCKEYCIYTVMFI